MIILNPCSDTFQDGLPDAFIGEWKDFAIYFHEEFSDASNGEQKWCCKNINCTEENNM
jgi:hypothetical protein